MPRPSRTDFPGAWHHVMNRGADHRDIFEQDADRETFLDSLVEAVERAALEVHSYCLMSNHFHLLLRSTDGRLAAGMQHLAGRFTRMINVRVGRDGPLFRGRYASVAITSDAHLVQVCRYIHHNPVRAGIVAAPEVWSWSSAGAYIGRCQAPAWPKTEYVMDLFGPENHLANYRDYMRGESDASATEFYAKLGW